MIQGVKTQKELLEENKILQEKLSIAEQWIGRELHDKSFQERKNQTLHSTRNQLRESPEEIWQRCKNYLWENFSLLLPEYQELLVESEINFSHIIGQKNIDGFVVTNCYQKILEFLFEEHFTRYFREKFQKKRIIPRKNDLLEKTLYKVLKNNFHLSLGKLYLIMQKWLEEGSWELVKLFQESIEETPLYVVTNTAEFWDMFTSIIETQAFWEKRHQGKITLKDTRLLREKITGNFESEGFLKLLLTAI